MKELISAVTNQPFGYVPKMKVSTDYCFKLRKNHYRNAFLAIPLLIYIQHMCVYVALPRIKASHHFRITVSHQLNIIALQHFNTISSNHLSITTHFSLASSPKISFESQYLNSFHHILSPFQCPTNTPTKSYALQIFTITALRSYPPPIPTSARRSPSAAASIAPPPR